MSELTVTTWNVLTKHVTLNAVRNNSHVEQA